MADIPTSMEPDGKDWTWVLDRRCPECGFVASSINHGDVASLLRENAAAWVELLAASEAMVRARPSPTTWSTLEYACHVRDVCRLYLLRLEMMLDEEGPKFPDWNQDETAVAARYDLAEAATVAGELATDADALASRFETVTGDQWDRTGLRSDGAAFTIDTFSRYLIHDPIHHLWDVERPTKTA